jgi:hypothetical protein
MRSSATCSLEFCIGALDAEHLERGAELVPKSLRWIVRTCRAVSHQELIAGGPELPSVVGVLAAWPLIHSSVQLQVDLTKRAVKPPFESYLRDSRM